MSKKVPKYVQDEMKKAEPYCEKMAATSAFNIVMGSKYDFPDHYDASIYAIYDYKPDGEFKYVGDYREGVKYYEKNYIPEEFVSLLMDNKLKTKYSKEKKYAEVQKKFDEQLSFYRNDVKNRSAKALRNSRVSTTLVTLLTVFLVSWAGYSVYKRTHEPIAPQQENVSSPETNSNNTNQGIVKKSTTGICHAPGTTYYDRTENYTPYDNVNACIASGGRLPLK